MPKERNTGGLCISDDKSTAKVLLSV